MEMAALIDVVVEVDCARTKLGDHIGLVGGVGGIGDWSPARAVRLDGASFPIWRATVSLEVGRSVEYKYVILKQNGGAAWEAFDGNRVRTVSDVAETWKDGKFGEKGIATSTVALAVSSNPAVAECTSADPRGGTVDKGAHTSAAASPPELLLSIHCDETGLGDVVAIAGSWDWKCAPLALDGSTYPVWRHRLIVDGRKRIEYKFLVLKKDGMQVWEPMNGNRVLEGADLDAKECDLGKLRFAPPSRSSQKDHKAGRQSKNGASPPSYVEGNSGNLILGADRTIYGKVSLDYGTIEQRMAKRMGQPTNLEGDYDEQLHHRARNGQRASLHADVPSLEQALRSRAVPPSEVGQPPWQGLPPTTRIEEDSAQVFAEIVALEGQGTITLADRFDTALRILEGAAEGSAVPWTVLVWLRFSQARQLTWQRKRNTKPAHLSSAAQSLSELISARWKDRGGERLVWRLLLSCVPRGSRSDDGQAIRDYILVIMQKHQLKKRKGDFMEQWHQKLHNNTTPDDIHICEAYLQFLRSDGNLALFYEHLEGHGITRERLQTFERPILQEPVFFASIKNGLINDFQHYLEILKNVHAGADLEKCLDAAGGLDGNLRGILEAVIAESGAGEHRLLPVLGGIAEARAGLACGGVGTTRDGLYLDLALEAQARLLAERLGSHIDVRSAALAVTLLFEGLSLSIEASELRAAASDLVAMLGREGTHESMRASAAAARVRGSLAGVADVFVKLQPRAETLGAALRQATPEALPEAWAVSIFSEELARGGPGFAVSLLLSTYERQLRNILGAEAWQMVSVTDRRLGKLVVVPEMRGEDVLDGATVLLTEKLRGEEDPPEGAVAVLTPDAVDVLSHVAVRARTMGIFLATCFDADVWESVRHLRGQHVSVSAKAGAVMVEVAAEAAGGADTAVTRAGLAGKKVSVPGLAGKKVSVPRPAPSEELWVQEHAISACKAAGAKSHNLVALRNALPDWIQIPQSAVVPYGVLDRVLHSPENATAARRYQEISAELSGSPAAADARLQEIRKLIHGLQPPAQLMPALQAAVEAHGASAGDARWWEALTGVWASSWNDRAYHACRRAGIQPSDVAMAVLVQRIVPAEYSFVVHTRHPTGDPSELYAEIVLGLGEVLVGNYAGRALAFAAPRDGSAAPRVTCLPSKGVAMSGSGLIFRSDSNAEDLEDFAGAGLFDSITARETSERVLRYGGEPLVDDAAFREKLLKGIASLSMAVEKAAGGGPQDIEGCYAGGKYFVVQTRPQA